MRIMARLMMSAAEPCSGALIAWRSPKLRSAELVDLICGSQHLRPKMVET